MIDYPTFLANAQPEDIRVMNLFAMGQRISFTDAAEADAMFARAVRLDSAGFMLRLDRSYERRDGVMWQHFTGYIEPAAANYLATAAAERVRLSRDPLPPETP